MQFKEHGKNWFTVRWDDGIFAGEIYQPRQIEGVVFDHDGGSLSTNQLREIVDKMEELERGL